MGSMYSYSLCKGCWRGSWKLQCVCGRPRWTTSDHHSIPGNCHRRVPDCSPNEHVSTQPTHCTVSCGGSPPTKKGVREIGRNYGHRRLNLPMAAAFSESEPTVGPQDGLLPGHFHCAALGPKVSCPMEVAWSFFEEVSGVRQVLGPSWSGSQPIQQPCPPLMLSTEMCGKVLELQACQTVPVLCDDLFMILRCCSPQAF